MDQCYKRIVPQIMMNLNKSQEDFQDDEEQNANTIYASSFRCLIPINRALREQMEPISVEFIEMTIKSGEAEQIVAGLSVYSCLSYGMGNIKFSVMFNQTIENIMNFLKNPNNHIKIRVQVL